VRAEISAASHPKALVVPIQAVVEREIEEDEAGGKAEEAKVVLLIENGKARQRRVETGISDDTHVELLSGVKPGDTVVTGPYRTLRDLEDGDAVKISETSEEEDRKRDTGEDSADEEE
jgi:HlyD family secretion protein